MTPQPEQQAREDIDRLLQAAGWAVQIQERSACKKRQRVGDADFRNGLSQLDRDVIAPDQIRIVIRSFRNKLFTEIFPGREWVPKTVDLAKDDALHRSTTHKLAKTISPLAQLFSGTETLPQDCLDEVSKAIVFERTHLPMQARSLYAEHILRSRQQWSICR